ncbi:MAG: hypothetical protein ACRELB_16910 [Polyangiaceae bacterium]
MASGEPIAVLLVVAFAVLVTVHVALVFGLAKRRPRWRAGAALLVPPLAPVWGWSGLRARAVLWLVAAVSYAVLRVLASR